MIDTKKEVNRVQQIHFWNFLETFFGAQFKLFQKKKVETEPEISSLLKTSGKFNGLSDCKA